jgi:GTP-binding protein
MKVSAEFVTSAAGAGDFPREPLREVALVGRSNVGKSSLINALVRQPLARTSAAPGKTRLANFFRVQRGSAAAFYLVDLPGYGYARAPRFRDRPGIDQSRVVERHAQGGQRSAPAGRAAATEEFRELTDAFFARPGERLVLLLIDARHPGLESDLEAWEWVRSRPARAGVVGTKVDKLTRAERARHARELDSLFAVPVPLVSAHTGEGLDELWTLIAQTPKPTAA